MNSQPFKTCHPEPLSAHSGNRHPERYSAKDLEWRMGLDIPRSFASTLRMTGVAMLCLLLGCQSAHVAEPLTHSITGDDADAQLEFWHQLETRPVTCNDEAFHGLILYLDQSDPSPDYVTRVNTLKSREILPKSFNQPGDEAISRGTLAVAISSALKIKGGMMLHLRPFDNGRYATRELVYMDLYPPSTPNQTFSGANFLASSGGSEDYRAAATL